MHEGLLGKKASLAVVASAESTLEPLAERWRKAVDQGKDEGVAVIAQRHPPGGYSVTVVIGGGV
jgi:hypothetical protein